jgi:hypothetical protein
MNVRQLLAVFVAAVAVLALILFASVSGFWEATLKGPYQGSEVYSTSNLSSRAAISLRGGAKLVAFEAEGEATIVSLKNPNGEVVWSRSLVTETANRTKIQNVSFLGSRLSDTGVKIEISCKWEGGDKEKGMLYLTPDLKFSGFSVSW